ncbi:hypothetical protein E2C01_045718 [Portunus trituberculatus]|uniref:Uncharacterized protein n=1 Tax=Portunus trituberculatus TaxID=210409 RepID=A0A5B7G5S3_PORTR|nr:hypothetical protein [Portunus trituberculatus]
MQRGGKSEHLLLYILSDGRQGRAGGGVRVTPGDGWECEGGMRSSPLSHHVLHLCLFPTTPTSCHTHAHTDTHTDAHTHAPRSTPAKYDVSVHQLMPKLN